LTEARLRLHEGSAGTFTSLPIGKVSDSASIESYLESQAQIKSQSNSSTMPTKESTSLPFPRVSATSKAPNSPQKSPRFSSFVEKRTKPTPAMISRPKTIAASVEKHKPGESKNPFEEEDKNNPFLEPTGTTTGGSKNPFEEDEESGVKNPFEEDEDSSRNPFT